MHHRITLLLVTCLLAVSSGQSQSFTWETLPTAPLASRIDDVSFINPRVGWVVNTRGQIWRTLDGGDSWEHMLDQSVTAFRSVAFIDSLHGFAGNLGTQEYAGATDPNVLYETDTGGILWTPVDITGPMPRGLCGMQAVNDSVIVACGRVRGPAFFVKSTDAGKTWLSTDMGSYAAGLVDTYFFTPDSGFVAGLTHSNHNESRGIILFTADGGATWDTSYLSSQTVEWCWKFSFPSKKVGYVSLQKNSGGPVNIIKTTNGGQSWQEKLLFESNYYVQGIGFATDSLGWVGGNSSFPALETRDGGDTWQSVDIGSRINRFQFFGDSVGYAVGRSVHKFRRATAVAVNGMPDSGPATFRLLQNFPNPVSATKTLRGVSRGQHAATTIRYTIPHREFVTLRIYNILGEEVAALIQKQQNGGAYEIAFDTSRLAHGVYIYRLRAGSWVETRKMMILP